MAQTTQKFKYKTLRKIQNTIDAIRSNTSWVKDSQLKDKLYKQYKELADEMVGKVQYIIDHRGAYENAGQDEIREFEDIVDRNMLDTAQQVFNLRDYINRKVDNLRYTNQTSQ